MSASTASVTVIRGGTVWTGGAHPRLLARHDVVISNAVVAAIEPGYRGRHDVEVDAGGCLVAPGLINAHVHPGTSPRSRGLAEDAEIVEDGAYYHVTLPTQMLGPQVLDDEDVAAITAWDVAASLLGGATTVVAEYFGSPKHWIPLVERIGFRGQLGLTYPGNLAAIGFVKDGRIVSAEAKDVGAELAGAMRLHESHNGAFGGRLNVHLSPHGPDTVPEDILRETKRLCAEKDIHAHLHLAQHVAECRTIEARHGMSPVQYLDKIGFLGPDVLATHVTYVNNADLDALARSGTHVVHCSYRKAKEGITSPFWEFLSRGVNVAIATDSFSHDLILDLKLACLLGKIRSHSVAHPTARQVLTCATHGAATALGRPDLGSLEPGARGDAIVVGLDSPFAAPAFDPIRALVYYGSASDIRTSLVDGQIVVERGTVRGLDLVALRRKVLSACHRLWTLAQDKGVLPEGSTYFPCPCGAH